MTTPTHAASPTGDTVTTASDDERFPQSVASGGPTANGVVLWTRLSPDSVGGDTSDDEDSAELVVEVAEDDSFADSVVEGTVPTDRYGPGTGHTVRVDVDGHLDPDTEYAYRFVHGGVASRTGHCRTLPAPDASPDSLRLAVVACQDYENGYYGAFSHVAAEDVDFLLHLGDVVYESAANLFGAGDGPVAGHELELPSGEPMASSLADYRYLHGTYRRDPHLQRALEAHTLVAGWDDHEIADDRYWDRTLDAPVVPDHDRGADPRYATDLTDAGIRAFHEFVPIRVRYDDDADHVHDRFRLYRSLRFGDLLDLLVTDQRFYRDGPPSPTVTLAGATFGLGVDDDADRTMLGRDQREWFGRQARSSEARWLTWASAVLTQPFRVGVGPLSVHPKVGATWDGYAAERRRLFADLGAADPAVVTLSGDLHTYVVGTQRLGGADGPAVGTEFMTPAVTSVNIAENAGVASGALARLTRPLFRQLFPAMNPEMAFFDSHDWGYSVVEFTREDCTYTAYAVDKTDDTADADRRELVRFRRSHDDPVPERVRE
nr:alkaline phosphatase D family protein [Halomarina rubra]